MAEKIGAGHINSSLVAQMAQCKFVKADGTQCKNNAVEGMKFCWLASHCGTAPAAARLWSLFTSNGKRFVAVISFAAAVVVFWPRVTPGLSDPRVPDDPYSISITATNSGYLPLDAVTISVGIKESCTATSGCNIPAYPDPNRFKTGVFKLGLKVLGAHDLGFDEKFSAPISSFIDLATPGSLVYADVAVVIGCELPVIHWKRSKVFPLHYYARDGRWDWG